MKYKTILVDDNDDFRNALKFILSSYKNVDIVGEATNGDEFLTLLDTVVPDLVFMDIEMPDMNGIEATKRAIRRYGKLKIIGLTFHKEFKYVNNLIHAGARNYIVKNELNKNDLDRIFNDLTVHDHIT